MTKKTWYGWDDEIFLVHGLTPGGLQISSRVYDNLVRAHLNSKV